MRAVNSARIASLRFQLWLPLCQALVFACLMLMAQVEPKGTHAAANNGWTCIEEAHEAEPAALMVAILLDAPGASVIPLAVPFEFVFQNHAGGIILGAWGLGTILQWFLIGGYIDSKRGLVQWQPSPANFRKRAVFVYGVACAGVGLAGAAYSLSKIDCIVAADIIVATGVCCWAVVMFVVLMRWRNSWPTTTARMDI